MKQSFLNDRGRSVNDLSDYQSSIHGFRDLASKTWRENCVNYGDQTSFNSKQPPAFFIDRYSFRSWLVNIASVSTPEHTAIPEVDFTNLFESYDETVRKSVVGSKILGTEAPSVDEPVHRSQFLDRFFSAWQKHLADNGIDLPTETIDWYVGTSMKLS